MAARLTACQPSRDISAPELNEASVTKHLVLCNIERRPPRLDLDIYPYLPRAQVEMTRPAS
jgi:hypothetical protein